MEASLFMLCPLHERGAYTSDVIKSVSSSLSVVHPTHISGLWEDGGEQEMIYCMPAGFTICIDVLCVCVYVYIWVCQEIIPMKRFMHICVVT